MLHITGIIISLFLSILLFTKKGKSGADLLLAFWLLLISLHLVTYYLLATGKFIEFPYLLGVEIAFPFIHGPFLYLYTSLLTGKKITNLKFGLHFIPTLLVYVVLLKFFLLPIAEKILVYENQGAGYTTILKIIHFAVIPSGVVYIVLSLLLLKEHRRIISNQLSAVEKINLNWLSKPMIGMGLIWLSVLFGNDRTTFTCVDLFILYIGYFGVKQVGIFTNKIDEQPLPHEEIAFPVKYQKSAIGEVLLSEIHAELLKLMEQKKLFRDPELSLNELAKQLGVHPNSLSQVINTLEHKNFYDYINALRINEFKTIMLFPENQKFTMLSLAYEVGFNSKTSFNRNFKKITGLSPTAYLKQHKIRLQVTI
ncbi:AraC-like DNA-binding protein [Mucilaginibacter sp. SG538B]|uniref:helix-turn-helix domain-containing protein n=1 Tax=Mucilaginibacter sp. SG538B TaxID=2587021 RepID=UPI00159E87BA|nr:helix-turn-helix domain-containing protein [Mucilaginibacter sp. SG538B]NVM66565.1 AraC-like DNA-binding protein [Mucilaginibacter sp. SG538B]